MKRWNLLIVVVAMGLMALPATAYLQAQPEPATIPPAAGNPPGLLGAFKTMDDQLVDVGSIVPGFGGMYVNESEKVLYVYAVGKNDAATLRQAIAKAFGPEVIPSGGVKVIAGTYTIPHLTAWYRLINQHVFSLPGVTATDLQEAGNHLWIGIKDESVRAQVEGEVARLGIPPNAVVIEVFGPVRESSHTLQNAVRPVDAGVQIQNESNGGLCTYGFTVLLNGTRGMVTNSHCTRTQGAVDSDRFHQPTVSGETNLVGTETIDPAFFTSTKDNRCPPGYECRYSDSAFAQSAGNLTLNLGYIARPTALGAITIDHNSPKFRITATGAPVIGNWVHQVGRSSGWTQGQVTYTCVNVANPNGYVMVCQNRASYNAINGDSGSPVFMPVNASGDVKLVGIHWGTVTGSTDRVFSTLGGVWSDLAPGGTFQVVLPA